MQSFDFSQFLSCISIISTIVVGCILYRQIKSQKEIIERYKDYIQTIDIKKFQEYITFLKSSNEEKIEHELYKKEAEFEKTDNKRKDKYSEHCTELTMLIRYFMNSNTIMTVEEKKEFIKAVLPKTGHIVSRFIS